MSIQQQASISVAPSLWEEPFGRTVLEAMASGCACLSSRRGGIPEVTGENAILLDDISAEKIATALQKLIDDSEYRTQLQTAGKYYVDNLFNIERQSRKLYELRSKLLL
jgi:glycosyltransferase involved in cell wall biosynthesis